MDEPLYYCKDGLSPVKAFQQGLISKEEYKGFLKGNVIKYCVRAGDKEDAGKDIDKGIHYFQLLKELLTDNLEKKETDIKLEELKKEMMEFKYK